MPVSIPASGRRKAGRATNGERNPWASWNGPMLPEETQEFQKRPSGKLRYRTSVVWPEAAGSERSRFSASRTPCGPCRHGWCARTKSWEENTPPVTSRGAKRTRSKARSVAKPKRFDAIREAFQRLDPAGTKRLDPRTLGSRTRPIPSRAGGPRGRSAARGPRFGPPSGARRPGRGRRTTGCCRRRADPRALRRAGGRPGRIADERTDSDGSSIGSGIASSGRFFSSSGRASKALRAKPHFSSVHSVREGPMYSSTKTSPPGFMADRTSSRTRSMFRRWWSEP